MRKLFASVFSSLKYRNFRLFITGQLFSITGSWIQAIALNWLAYEMTGSAVTLGYVTALQFLPLLVFGIFGGYFVDRLPKYKTVLVVQVLQFIMPFVVAMLLFAGELSIYFLYACALWAGLLRVVDSPVRQSLRFELVPKSEIKNVISLFSTINGLGRTVGPLISGFVLVALGAAWCFLLNAISYLVVVFLVMRMRPEEFNKMEIEKGGMDHGGLLSDLREIWCNEVVRNTLLIAVILGTFILTVQTTMPIVVKEIFAGTAMSYAVIISFYSIGCVLGGLYGAQDRVVSRNKVKKLSIVLAILFASLALPISYHLFLFLVLLVGFFGILTGNNANALIVLNTKERIMGLTSSLWAMAIIGTTSLGGIYTGYTSEHLGVQYAIFISGLALFLYALVYRSDK